MVSAAPKLVAKTAKVTTNFMESASFVAILDGRGHSAKREVNTYSDIFCHINNFLHRIHIDFCIICYIKYLLKSMAPVKPSQDKSFM